MKLHEHGKDKNTCQTADIGYLEVGRCVKDKVGEPKTGTKEGT